MERLTERSENGKAVYRHPTREPEGWKANRAAVLERCCRYEETGLEPEEIEELIKQAIANCHLVNLYGIDPGMEEGMCAGLRTMSGKGEPCDTCQECRLQYQYAEEHS